MFKLDRVAIDQEAVQSAMSFGIEAGIRDGFAELSRQLTAAGAPPGDLEQQLSALLAKDARIRELEAQLAPLLDIPTEDLLGCAEDLRSTGPSGVAAALKAIAVRPIGIPDPPPPPPPPGVVAEPCGMVRPGDGAVCEREQLHGGYHRQTVQGATKQWFYPPGWGANG